MQPVAAMRIEHERKTEVEREANRIDDWGEYTQKNITLAAIHPDIHKLINMPGMQRLIWHEYNINSIYDYGIYEVNKPSSRDCTDDLYIMPKSLEIISFEETKKQIIRKMHNMVDAGLVKIGQYHIAMPSIATRDGKRSYKGGFIINFTKDVDIDDRCRIKNLLDQTFFRGKFDPKSPSNQIPHMMRCSWLKKNGVRYQNRPSTVGQIQRSPRLAKAPVMKERELVSKIRPRVTKEEKEKEESERQEKEKEKEEREKEEKEKEEKEKEEKEEKDKEKEQKEKREKMRKEKARLEREKRLKQEDDEDEEEEQKEVAKVESLPVAPRRMRTLPVRRADSRPKIPSQTIWQALDEPTEELTEEAEEPSEVRTPVSTKEVRSKFRTGKKPIKKPKAAASAADDWTGEEELLPET
jgi:hypothetical protein